MMTSSEIENLVQPMLLSPLPAEAYERLAAYMDLLFRWNARMNLTAVRDPAVMVRVHLGECLRAAQFIPADVRTVLDFGSGAGLPGIPMQIARPELAVTLAESQKKKAGFLREVIREIDLHTASVHAGRVEDMAAGLDFDVVAMRAVDRMERALHVAAPRIRRYCMVLTSETGIDPVRAALPGFDWKAESVPGTRERIVLIGSRSSF